MKIYAHDPRYIFEGRPDSQSDAVVVREIFCENVYEVFDGDLTDTGVVVDLGANIGAFSLFAASLGAKRVIAVEPEMHNLQLLRANISANKKNSPDCTFTVAAFAIGRHDTDEAFVDNNHGDSRIIENRAMSEGMAKVPMLSLDSLFKRYELEYIDVLKIDVEGYEGDVLLAASESTMNLCRYITIEYDQSSNNLGAIIEKLTQTHQVKVVGKAGGMIFAKRY